MNKNNIDIIKIGGSVLIEETGRIRTKICKEIFDILRQSSNPKIIIIGCGKKLHDLTIELNLTDKPKITKFGIEGMNERAANFFKLNSFIENNIKSVKKIAKDGVVPILPAALFVKASTGSYDNNEIALFNNGPIDIALSGKSIPLTSGGIVLDQNVLVSAISSDTIATYLALEYNVRRLILLTDVEGIYENPNSDKCIKSISLKKMLNYRIDGGMRDKLRRIKPAVEKDIHVHILSGLQPECVAEFFIKQKTKKGTRVVI
jgi:isopentenyl phosphate kinase